jgi:hypothetical protein
MFKMKDISQQVKASTNSNPGSKTGYDRYRSQPGNQNKTLEEYEQVLKNFQKSKKKVDPVPVYTIGGSIFVGNMSSADQSELNEAFGENDDKTHSY